MEKQKLPNSTLILIFGILSILGCCCGGIVGLIFGIIALVMANSAIKTYMLDPELYTGYNNVKTGRILAIIGVVLSAIYLIVNLYYLSQFDWDYLEMQRQMMEEYGMQ